MKRTTASQEIHIERIRLRGGNQGGRPAAGIARLRAEVEEQLTQILRAEGATIQTQRLRGLSGPLRGQANGTSAGDVAAAIHTAIRQAGGKV